MIGRLRQVDWSALAELAVLTAVLAIAALVSYTHLRDVWIAAGSPWPNLGPLLVDGLFAAAWLRMRRRRRQGDPVGVLAWLALGLALVATLAGNVAAAIVTGHGSALSLVVAAWPAVAFALVWELVTGHQRRMPSVAPAPPDAPTRETETTTDDELLSRARDLMPIGRPKLAKELEISDYQARRLLETLATDGHSATNGAAQ